MVGGLPYPALFAQFFESKLFGFQQCCTRSNAGAHVVLKYLCTVLVLVPKAFAISPILSP